MLHDDFKPVVDSVLNSWTALIIAVRHGPPGALKTAQSMSAHIARYCVDKLVDTIHIQLEPAGHIELQEVIENYMEKELDMICRDGSPRVIAQVLLKYLKLLKEGCHDDVRKALNKNMPKHEIWLTQPAHESILPQVNIDGATNSSN